jgi:hypothetical protein
LNVAGPQLFKRKWRVTVDTVETEELRVQFKVKKTSKPDPNTCEIKIYNLGQDNRAVLSHATGGKQVAKLEAGYEPTGLSLLFLGEVRNAFTEWSGPDCITTVTTGDSESEMREARIHATLATGAPVEDALFSIAKAFGVGLGNIDDAAKLLKSKGAVQGMFASGTALSGSAKRVMTEFCQAAGLEWSIQNGALQILDRGKALAATAVELSSSTGLIGSPSVDYKSGTKNGPGAIYVKCKCLLIPDLAPGRAIALRSRDVSGQYRIDSLEYQGDSHGEGNDWIADLVLRSVA